MSVAVSQNAIAAIAAGNGGRPLPVVGPQPSDAVLGRFLFAGTLVAGALAIDANALDLTLVASCRDPNLRRIVGFTQNAPQTVGRIYAFRAHWAPDPATGLPVAEDAMRVMQEDLMLVTGPANAPKFSAIGTDAGSLYPSRANSAATTVAATTIDRTTAAKVSAWKKVSGGGDFVDLSSDIFAIRAVQATTLVACRLLVEVVGEFARRGAVDWGRGACPPDAKQAAYLEAYTRDVYRLPV